MIALRRSILLADVHAPSRRPAVVKTGLGNMNVAGYAVPGALIGAIVGSYLGYRSKDFGVITVGLFGAVIGAVTGWAAGG